MSLSIEHTARCSSQDLLTSNAKLRLGKQTEEEMSFKKCVGATGVDSYAIKPIQNRSTPVKPSPNQSNRVRIRHTHVDLNQVLVDVEGLQAGSPNLLRR